MEKTWRAFCCFVALLTLCTMNFLSCPRYEHFWSQRLCALSSTERTKVMCKKGGWQKLERKKERRKKNSGLKFSFSTLIPPQWQLWHNSILSALSFFDWNSFHPFCPSTPCALLWSACVCREIKWMRKGKLSHVRFVWRWKKGKCKKVKNERKNYHLLRYFLSTTWGNISPPLRWRREKKTRAFDLGHTHS